MIGNTPLLLIPTQVHQIPWLTLYAKLEYQNPFGSLKDRFAWNGIKDDIEIIKQKNGKILESSSGNTIKALAGIANTFGISSKTITNRIKVQEQKDILTLMWVDIQQLPSDGQCIDLNVKNNAVELIEQECKSHNEYFHTDQYRNPKNTQAHIDTTWPEIYDDLWNIDYFFGSLGTAGSSGWVTKFLRTKNPNLVSVGIVSDADDFIPWIRNIKEMQEVGIFDPNLYDAIQEVYSIKAIHNTISLIKNTWIMWWPTSGAVYTWLLDYFQNHPIQDGKNKVWVLIICDRVEPYMSYIKKRLPEIFHQEHKLCILNINWQEQQKYAKIISVKELETLLQNKPQDILLIDTRSNTSFVLGSISGAINIELDLLTELTDKWKIFDKTKKVILLCPLGKQTKKLCAYLNMSGFDAYSLEWWLKNWKKNTP